jgi:thiol peroxidase
MNITFKGNEVHLYGQPLKAGDLFPDFMLTDLQFNDVESATLAGPKVILTLPSADASTSTLELLTLTDRLESHPELTVHAVSLDLPFTLRKWNRDNAGDYITLYSDSKFRTFGEITGTYVEELGILAPAVFVVDRENRITYVEYVPEISHEPNYDRLLEEAAKTVKA